MELIEIQKELKAPKDNFNNFGKYKYRSCEDILEKAKPKLEEKQCYVTLSDDVLLVGDRFYIKAKATLYRKDNTVVAETIGLAREEQDKKGMDSSQITGSASSYARKYALCGLFAIDDTKDADSVEESKKVNNNLLPSSCINFSQVADSLCKAKNIDELNEISSLVKDMNVKDMDKEKLRKIYLERKNMLTNSINNQQFVL